MASFMFDSHAPRDLLSFVTDTLNTSAKVILRLLWVHVAQPHRALNTTKMSRPLLCCFGSAQWHSLKCRTPSPSSYLQVRFVDILPCGM